MPYTVRKLPAYSTVGGGKDVEEVDSLEGAKETSLLKLLSSSEVFEDFDFKLSGQRKWTVVAMWSNGGFAHVAEVIETDD